MSAVTDSQVGASSSLPSAPEPGDPPPADEALETLLPRYARLGLTLAAAEACVVRVRRGDQSWQTARAGAPTEGAGDVIGEDERFCDRTQGRRAPLREDGRIGLPIGRRGSLMVRMPRGGALGTAAQTALDDLVVLLAREVGGGTERAAAAEAARAAAVEVEHQMRNGFAKINAMIDIAAREDLPRPDFVRTLKRRLAALGEANEVAIAHGFGAAPLAAVIRGAFAAVLGRNHGEGVVRLDGEPLLVSPAVASVLAPIFGELAADALERGALRTDMPVQLTWHHQTGRERVVFRWEEPPAGAAAAFVNPFLRSGGPNTLRAEAVIDAAHDEPDRGAAYRLAIPDRFVAKAG